MILVTLYGIGLKKLALSKHPLPENQLQEILKQDGIFQTWLKLLMESMCIYLHHQDIASSFFNYRKTHSVVLLRVCDAIYKFTLVDSGR